MGCACSCCALRVVPLSDDIYRLAAFLEARRAVVLEAPLDVTRWSTAPQVPWESSVGLMLRLHGEGMQTARVCRSVLGTLVFERPMWAVADGFEGPTDVLRWTAVAETPPLAPPATRARVAEHAWLARRTVLHARAARKRRAGTGARTHKRVAPLPLLPAPPTPSTPTES